LPLVYTRHNIDQHAIHFTFDLWTTIVSNCHGVVQDAGHPADLVSTWTGKTEVYTTYTDKTREGLLVGGVQNDILGTSKPIDQRAFTKRPGHYTCYWLNIDSRPAYSR
jgi:hypothetical protein